MVIILILGFMVGVAGAWAIGSYNALIRLRNQLERAWSNIDVLLKQRFEEIPQLIQVIEQYVQYESGILEKLASARAQYGSANSVPDKIKAGQEMSLALKGVIAIGEGYPELKANTNFQQLLTRVSSLESGISDRRETYNDAVATFNTRIEQFPDVFAARFLNYQRQELFKIEGAQREKPSLKMNLPKFGQGA